MDDMAGASRDAYRALVYDTPGFVDYFRRATPVDVIERCVQLGYLVASKKWQPWGKKRNGETACPGLELSLLSCPSQPVFGGL